MTLQKFESWKRKAFVKLVHTFHNSDYDSVKYDRCCFNRKCESEGANRDKLPIRRLGFQNSELDESNAWCSGENNIYSFGGGTTQKLGSDESPFVRTQRTTAALSGGIEVYAGRESS